MLFRSNDIEFFSPLGKLFEMAKDKVCHVAKPRKIRDYMHLTGVPNAAEIWEKIKDESTVNAGMFAGPAPLILEAVKYIAENLKHFSDYGADQLLLNVLIYYVKIPNRRVGAEWNFDWRQIAILHKITG